MADRFNVVAVGIENEGAVVGRMVLRTEPGTTVSPPARRDSSLVEGVHSRAVVASECDMDGGAERTLPDPEIRLIRLSEPHTGDVVLHDQLVAEWRQSLLVEALAPLKVRCGKTNVIQHRSPPTASGTDFRQPEYTHDVLLSNG